MRNVRRCRASAHIVSDGTEARLGTLAAGWDWSMLWRTIDGTEVAHFEQRQAAMEGRAIVVCMSRCICVDLHNAIARLPPGCGRW